MLYLAHNSHMAGHPEERRMYSKMWLHFYWPHLSINVQAYVVASCKCLAEWVT